MVTGAPRGGRGVAGDVGSELRDHAGELVAQHQGVVVGPAVGPGDVRAAHAGGAHGHPNPVRAQGRSRALLDRHLAGGVQGGDAHGPSMAGVASGGDYERAGMRTGEKRVP